MQRKETGLSEEVGKVRLGQRDKSSWRTSRWWPLFKVAGTARTMEQRWETAGLFGDFQLRVARA